MLFHFTNKYTTGQSISGNCYVASEALYHILGGKEAGWKPMRMRVDHPLFKTHWFLKHESGMIVDPSRYQFHGMLPDYSKAVGSGFLTKKPSKRALKLMWQMTWQNVKKNYS